MPSHRPLSRKSPKTASGSSEKRKKHSKHTPGKPFLNFISILMYFRRKPPIIFDRISAPYKLSYYALVTCALARMPSTEAATDFLTTLDSFHPSLSFTIEFPDNNKIPFIGIEIIKNGTRIETQVYRKPTNTGLLLDFQSHTDKRYKECLLKTMIHRAHSLSSTTEAFNEECNRLRGILRANVAKNQTFSKYCGNSSKINSAHILMLGRP